MLADLQLRAFEDRDYGRLVEIVSAVDSNEPRSVEAWRYRDRTWSPDYQRVRVVAELAGRVVGWGQVGHLWFAFHPRRFGLRVDVEPAAQGQRIGSALHELLLAQARAWGAELVRAEARASDARGMEFLARREYVAKQRRWDARLVLSEATPGSELRRGMNREVEGIRISTFAVERARRGRGLLRQLYALEVKASETEPRPDADVVMSFDRFITQELEEPQSLPDGHFLALDGERVVGLSRLATDFGRAGVLEQGFTAVHPDYRGRGIARALKLRTLDYARHHGYREIRTQMDETNAPMLHINQALGFVKRDEFVVFEARMSGYPPG